MLARVEWNERPKEPANVDVYSVGEGLLQSVTLLGLCLLIAAAAVASAAF